MTAEPKAGHLKVEATNSKSGTSRPHAAGGDGESRCGVIRRDARMAARERTEA
jgi:hypothetical protein